MVYPVYLPSVYMMSPHVTKFSQAFPPQYSKNGGGDGLGTRLVRRGASGALLWGSTWCPPLGKHLVPSSGEHLVPSSGENLVPSSGGALGA